MDHNPVDPTLLKEIVEGSGLSFVQNNVSWIFTCPRCGKAKKLYLRKRDGRFVCWKCAETDNFRGRPEYALAELLSCSVKEIAGKLYGEVPLSTEMYLDVKVMDPYGDAEDDDFGQDDGDFTTTWPWNFYEIDAPESKRGREYLAGRGIPINLAKAYDLRYNPEQRRVYFPVGSRGKLFGWQGRLVVPVETYEVNGELRQTLKILSSQDIQREKRLMFLDRLEGVEHAVLCEGPVDALKAHYCKGNVATMGKAVSRGQIQLLRSTGRKRLYLALDPDAADETQRLVDELGGEMELYEMTPKNDELDLGAMPFEEVYQLFLGARRIETGRIFIFLNPWI